MTWREWVVDFVGCPHCEQSTELALRAQTEAAQARQRARDDRWLAERLCADNDDLRTELELTRADVQRLLPATVDVRDGCEL